MNPTIILPTDPHPWMTRFAFGTELILQNGGWFEGRAGFFNPPHFPDMPDWESFPLAETILGEFSGLTVGRTGKGINRPSYCIKFDPAFPWSYYDYGQHYFNTYGKRLYPLGELGAPYIFIDEEELVVIHYFVRDEMAIIGKGFDKVLDMLLLGYGPRYEYCPLK